MPQLMPLLWSISIMMSLLIMMMLFNLFYYKLKFAMEEKSSVKVNYEMNFKW